MADIEFNTSNYSYRFIRDNGVSLLLLPSLFSCGVYLIDDVYDYLYKNGIKELLKGIRILVEDPPCAFVMISIVPDHFHKTDVDILNNLFSMSETCRNPNSGNDIVIGYATRDELLRKINDLI